MRLAQIGGEDAVSISIGSHKLVQAESRNSGIESQSPSESIKSKEEEAGVCVGASEKVVSGTSNKSSKVKYRHFDGL